MGLLVCAVFVLVGPQHDGEAHDDTEGEGGHHHVERGCRGFVILPNGFAVLSGLSDAPAHGSAGTQHDVAHMVGNNDRHGPTSGTSQHLMGYTHGQEIVPQEDMLCVPIVSTGTLKWTVIGRGEAPTVTMEYLQGAWRRGSRAHIKFALTIRQQGALIDTAQVRLLARMPHHDRSIAGGHGPANDPEVQGIVAQAVGQGRYTSPTITFTMAGPWLFEVKVQQDAEIHTVYLAAYIGKE